MKARVKSSADRYLEKERVATVARQLEDIEKAVGQVGFGLLSSWELAHNVAKMIEVPGRRVLSWINGEAVPAGRQAKALAILARIARGVLASHGGADEHSRDEATRLLRRLLGGGASFRDLDGVVAFMRDGWVVPNACEWK